MIFTHLGLSVDIFFFTELVFIAVLFAAMCNELGCNDPTTIITSLLSIINDYKLIITEQNKQLMCK